MALMQCAIYGVTKAVKLMECKYSSTCRVVVVVVVEWKYKVTENGNTQVTYLNYLEIVLGYSTEEMYI